MPGSFIPGALRLPGPWRYRALLQCRSINVILDAMSMDAASLKHSAQRAFLFNIPPDVRMISIEWSGENLIRGLVCSTVELTEDDVESIHVACTEMICDFANPHLDTRFEFIVSDADIMTLPYLSILIFAQSR
jgi:hypothetical protein